MDELSTEQRDAAEWLLRNRSHRQVQTLGGYAGTGKTTLVTYLFGRLLGFGVCAYTGKAADVLRRKGLPGETIHSTIYRPVKVGRRVEFELKSRFEIGFDGFLVDEGSMVGADLFADLCSFGLPVIVVGDHGQLPPVGNDAGLMKSPDLRLETVHRNAGPIAKFAEHLRLGGHSSDWFDPDERVAVVNRTAVSQDRLSRADQIICVFNRTRVGLNRTVRRFRGLVGDKPEVGDRVMCLRNDRAAGVFNGQQGEVVELDGRWFLFRPSHGREDVWVNYHPEQWNSIRLPQMESGSVPGHEIPFDFAYCVTGHKAQGDEWGNVVVYEERCDSLWSHARWSYTAASRAKGSLTWVAC